MSISRVKRGDVLTAAKINELVDDANRGDYRQVFSARKLEITIRNNTSNNIRAGEALAITGMRNVGLLPDAACSQMLTSGFQLEGNALDGSGNQVPAIALASIPAGEIGKCSVPGLIGTYVQNMSTPKSYAKQIANGYEAADDGDMRVLGYSQVDSNEKRFCYMVAEPKTALQCRVKNISGNDLKAGDVLEIKTRLLADDDTTWLSYDAAKAQYESGGPILQGAAPGRRFTDPSVQADNAIRISQVVVLLADCDNGDIAPCVCNGIFGAPVETESPYPINYGDRVMEWYPYATASADNTHLVSVTDNKLSLVNTGSNLVHSYGCGGEKLFRCIARSNYDTSFVSSKYGQRFFGYFVPCYGENQVQMAAIQGYSLVQHPADTTHSSCRLIYQVQIIKPYLNTYGFPTSALIYEEYNTWLTEGGRLMAYAYNLDEPGSFIGQKTKKTIQTFWKTWNSDLQKWDTSTETYGYTIPFEPVSGVVTLFGNAHTGWFFAKPPRRVYETIVAAVDDSNGTTMIAPEFLAGQRISFSEGNNAMYGIGGSGKQCVVDWDGMYAVYDRTNITSSTPMSQTIRFAYNDFVVSTTDGVTTISLRQ